MSVLNPLSTVGSKSGPGRGWSLLLGLLLGGAVGGSVGFFLGRKAAQTPPAGTASTTTDVGSAASGVSAVTPATEPQTGAEPVVSPDGGVAVNTKPDGVKRLDLVIKGSLYASLSAQLETRQADLLNAQLGRILTWWMDLRREVLPGDQIQALYEPTEGPGELRILALRYSSEKRNTVHQAYYYHPPAAPYGHYYDAKGEELEQRLVDSPLKEYEQITELLNNTGRRHKGVDFKADVGTPVALPYKAQVIRRNWSTRGNGYCLEVRFLQSGITALFLHLSEVLPVAQPGAVLEAGTAVANTGNTGHSTAPHLHYQLNAGSGALLNPFRVHPTYRLKLEGDNLAAFEKQKKELEDRLLKDHPSKRDSPE